MSGLSPQTNICICDGCGQNIVNTSLYVLRSENSPINLEYCGKLECKDIIDQVIYIGKILKIDIDIRPRIEIDISICIIPEHFIIDILSNIIRKFNIKYVTMLSLGRINWLWSLSLMFTTKEQKHALQMCQYNLINDIINSSSQ